MVVIGEDVERWKHRSNYPQCPIELRGGMKQVVEIAFRCDTGLYSLLNTYNKLTSIVSIIR